MNLNAMKWYVWYALLQIVLVYSAYKAWKKHSPDKSAIPVMLATVVLPP